MPLHDFQCADGHVHEELVKADIKQRECPECGQPAKRVFLVPPKIDWYGMAQGANAGPEFLARFDKNHRDKAEKERKSWNEHGDYGPGYSDSIPRQDGEPEL